MKEIERGREVDLIQAWRIGNTIKKLRESQGMKQDQLCQGLCSAATLCKFENGERDLDYFLVLMLMQRLGHDLEKCKYYASTKEWMQWEEMYTINRLRQEKQAEELFDALNHYRITWKESMENSRIQKQFVTWMEGVLEKWLGHYERAEMLLQTSISYTMPNGKKKELEKWVAGIWELEILTELGDVYEQNRMREKACSIWEFVWKQIERKNKITSAIVPLYTLVAVHLSPCLWERGSYWEGLSKCKKALKELSKHRRIDNWPSLLYWEGKFEEALLSMDELEDREEVMKTYRRAYYAARLFSESDLAEELRACLGSKSAGV